MLGGQQLDIYIYIYIYIYIGEQELRSLAEARGEIEDKHTLWEQRNMTLLL